MKIKTDAHCNIDQVQLRIQNKIFLACYFKETIILFFNKAGNDRICKPRIAATFQFLMVYCVLRL